MPFFIGYSEKDETFVDRLAAQLAFRRSNVWVDRWELKVGDSLLNRIQKALTQTSGLVVVCSKSAIAARWCRKELSPRLINQLEEKHVVVLPTLVEGLNECIRTHDGIAF